MCRGKTTQIQLLSSVNTLLIFATFLYFHTTQIVYSDNFLLVVLLLQKTGFSEILNPLFMQMLPGYRILKSKLTTTFLRNLEEVIPWYSDLCYFVKCAVHLNSIFFSPLQKINFSLPLVSAVLLQFVSVWIYFYLSSPILILSFQSEEITSSLVHTEYINIFQYCISSNLTVFCNINRGVLDIPVLSFMSLNLSYLFPIFVLHSLQFLVFCLLVH